MISPLKKTFVCLLGAFTLPASAQMLQIPEYGTLVKENGKYSFRLDEKANAARVAGMDVLRQWVVIGAEIQPPIPHRPNDQILTGGVGHFNIGMMRPYAGIPIFLAVGDEQPKLVGVSDGNGRFAIKLPKVAAKDEMYLFFSGSIDVQKEAQETEKAPTIQLWAFGDMNVASGRVVLSVGSRSERYRIQLPKSAEQGDQSGGRSESGTETPLAARKLFAKVKVGMFSDVAPSKAQPLLSWRLLPIPEEPAEGSE